MRQDNERDGREFRTDVNWEKRSDFNLSENNISSDISDRLHTHWKELFDETISPGVYEITTREQTQADAKDTVHELFDDDVEYYIWGTKMGKDNKKYRKPHVNVYVRTESSIDTESLPDTPRITRF